MLSLISSSVKRRFLKSPTSRKPAEAITSTIINHVPQSRYDTLQYKTEIDWLRIDHKDYVTEKLNFKSRLAAYWVNQKA